MKRIILTLGIIFVFLSGYGQVNILIEGGWATKLNSPVAGMSFEFSAHNLFLQPRMLIYTNSDAPVTFGLQMGYERYFNNVWLGAGYERGFDMFTQDSYDRYKNGWENTVFIRGGWKWVFTEVDRNDRWIFIIGIKHKLWEQW
jgi:hypothetical protein